jgi:hypothetical protein
MEHPYGEDDFAREAMKRKCIRKRKQLGLRTKAYVWIRGNNVEQEAIFDNTIVVKTAMLNFLGLEII